MIKRFTAFVEVKPYTETANQKASGVAMISRRSRINLNLLWILFEGYVMNNQTYVHIYVELSLVHEVGYKLELHAIFRLGLSQLFKLAR